MTPSLPDHHVRAQGKCSIREHVRQVPEILVKLETETFFRAEIKVSDSSRKLDRLFRDFIVVYAKNVCRTTERPVVPENVKKRFSNLWRIGHTSGLNPFNKKSQQNIWNSNQIFGFRNCVPIKNFLDFFPLWYRYDLSEDSLA